MKLDYETDAGLGTRARLGVIVLKADETLEAEFARIMALKGVALYHSRIQMVSEIRRETLAEMARDLPHAAALLPDGPDFDVIGYGCTSGATEIGSDRVAHLVQSVIPGARVTDPLAAIIAGVRALGGRRLGFVTPYVPQVSQTMRDALVAAGFSIAAFGSFNAGDDRVVARITPGAIARAAKRVARAAAADAPCDAIVIACTNLRCLGVIPEIEAETGIPVISSNSALGWHMLRLSGVTDQQSDLGRLFQQA